ncbi:hypothetical protein M2146_001178 [Lachnospiraceae bacterium PF1-22]
MNKKTIEKEKLLLVMLNDCSVIQQNIAKLLERKCSDKEAMAARETLLKRSSLINAMAILLQDDDVNEKETKKFDIPSENGMKGLVGFEKGKQDYLQYVEGKQTINDTDTLHIYFANDIVSIASSYAQGFVSELVDYYGYVKVREMLKVHAANQNIEESFIKNMFY